MSSLSDSDLATVQILIRIGSLLSILGSLSIILSYSFWPRFRTWQNRIVMIISCCDLVASIATGIGTVGYTAMSMDSLHSSVFCVAQAFTLQTFLLASVYWTAVLAVNMLLVMYTKIQIQGNAKLERLQIGIVSVAAFVPAFALCFITSPSPVYGNATLWCSITNSWGGLRLIFFFVPIWLCFVFSLVCYVLVARKLYAHRSERRFNTRKFNSDSEISFLKTSSSYLLAMMLTWIWSTINRMQNFVDPTNPVPLLYKMHGFFTPSLGFINFLVYFGSFLIKTFPHWFEIFSMKSSSKTILKSKKELNENKHQHVLSSTVLFDQFNSPLSDAVPESRPAQSVITPGVLDPNLDGPAPLNQ